MKFQVVLQWSGASESDYLSMVNLEQKLVDMESPQYEVDGHDCGSNERNIFILSNDPIAVFEIIKPILEKENELDKIRVAYREIKKSNFNIIWPKSLKSFEIS